MAQHQDSYQFSPDPTESQLRLFEEMEDVDVDRELDENPEEDHELNFFLEEYCSSIRTRHLTGRPVQDLYNFRLCKNK